MQITNITITNIKRYGTTDNSLNVTLKSNKYNLLVAPNGFGKSSLAKAFESLTPKGIALKPEYYHKGDKGLSPKIEVTIDGNKYLADSKHNNIGTILEPFVINSGLYPKGGAKMFNKKYVPKGSMKIKDIVIEHSVPNIIKLGYNLSVEKKYFGKNSKLLKSIDYLISNNNFCADLIPVFPFLDKYLQGISKNRQKLIDGIVNLLQSLQGTTSHIKSKIPQDLFDKIESEENYSPISALLSKYNVTSKLDRFLNFYQILHIYDKHKELLKKRCKRAKFEVSKASLQKTIDGLISPGYPITLIENKNRELVLSFPDAENISNGQRDLMSFFGNLIQFKYLINSTKNYLFIIDEVFDYLDDANFIVAQYYLSTILKEHSNVIIVILTHLDPRYFRMSTVFSPKKLNVQFMKNAPIQGISPLKQLVVFRQNLDHNSDLYRNISTYQFHYSPVPYNFNYSLSDGYTPILDNLNSTSKLKRYVSNELTNYFTGQSFDPIAVCLGIRYRSEKNVYNKLPEQEHNNFIAQKGTRNRLKYAESFISEGISDIYYILSVLHNEINHLSDVNEEKVCIYQLENSIIRTMIHALFGKDIIQPQDL